MSGRTIARRLAAAAGAAVLAVAAALAGPAAPAWAHATLVSTDPAKDSTVAAPVATITLTFNEMVKQSRTTITVTGPGGASYSDGPARVVDKNVQQAVKPLSPGAITVSWQTVSADGDAISGSFAFTSTAPAPTAAAPPPSPTAAASSAAPPATATSGPAAAIDPTSDEVGVSKVWWIVAALAVVGVTAGWLLARRRRLVSPPGD
jgi:methionine-rich copper-binding protein CopC